ncbi:50S ribosomal protein L9 [uncultured Corynebacterium sp.]|uniref:50S ribosomal protein L9 n=1 Tax=uncultured Corynebacterium sp. TaxID=159447 RepID=UPI0025E16CE6|nr:50S ribosomal protein L9 [uncultured Corynebacterium sp.]
MKLILTAAIDNLGVPGDIVEVKAGYGRNYLLPRGYAVPATRGAEKQVQDLKRAQEARAIRDADRAREVKEQLANLEGVSVAVRTANNGKLFGSVKPNDVAQAVVAAGGPELDKHSIDMTKGLVKSTGKYSVDVKLHEDIHGTINFEVVSQ